MPKLKEGNLVEKSKLLVWAKFDTYTAGELRLLDTYLSRIDARDPTSSTVQFTLAEYAKVMGLPDLRAEQVEPYLKHFVTSSVSIPIDPNNRKQTQFSVFPLFCEGTCLYDKTLRQYVISICCNPKLEDVFFNLAQSRYIRYRLRYTKDMKSQYSIRMYSMLRDWLSKGKYTVSVEQLREDLGANDSSYKRLDNFTRRVLDHAVNEINNVSDLNVTYTKVKKGRCITDICFKIKLKSSKKATGNQTKKTSTKQSTEHSGEWYAEAMENRISPESALKLAELVKNKIAKFHPSIPLNQREQAAKDILKSAYKNLLLGNTIADNPSGYLWSVLKSGSAIDNYLPIGYCIPLQQQK